MSEKVKIQVGGLLFRVDESKIRDIIKFISDRIDDIPEYGCPEIPEYVKDIKQREWVESEGWV